jgi:amidohydrolase
MTFCKKTPGSGSFVPGEYGGIDTDADREYESLFDLYRYFHAHPELSGLEERTSLRLAEELEAAGLRVTRGVGGHGVVGVRENGAGPVIMVRADLDALPIRESTGLPYACGEREIMHACGHDMHMTVLVGAARLLMRRLDKWEGTLVMVGQPSEETGTGAQAMLEDGLFTRFPRPDYILALHVSPPMPAGKIGYSVGATMAGCASMDLKISGVGGHGSRPNEAKDPIVLAAETILLLQTIVSREIDPKETAVVTVGAIHGGSRGNIIPDEVQLKINYRYFSPDVDRRISTAIERIVRGAAIAAGIPEERMPVLTTGMTGPPIFSDAVIAQEMGELFRAFFGEENVMKLDPLSASDDFAHFGMEEPRIPLFYFWLGVSDPEEVAVCAKENRPYPGIHNPSFAPLPESSIKTGVTAMTLAVLDMFRRSSREKGAD